MLPGLEGAESTSVGEVFLEELAEQSLVGAGLARVEGFRVSACAPDRDALARGGRDGPSAGVLDRADGADHPPHGVAEREHVGGLHRGMTDAAGMQGRGEPELGDEVPRAREAGLDCSGGLGRRHVVEGSGQRIEERGVALVGGAEVEDELGERGGPGEAPEIGAQGGSCVRNLERAQGLELAALLEVEVGDPLDEEVERHPESAAGPPHSFGERRLHADSAGLEPDDAGGFRIVEGVEDDGLGGDEGHVIKDRAAGR